MKAPFGESTMKYGTASLWSFGLLMLPGTALAAWGENWGEMVWGVPVSVPSVPGLGLIALALALSATAAWRLRKRRTALGLPVLLVLLAVPLVVVAGTVSVPNTFVNNAVADADEVNANFDVIEVEVNDNDSRITAAQAESLDIAADLAAEVVRAQAAEGVLSVDLSAEETRALAAEWALLLDIDAEVTRAELAEAANSAAISAEETRALAAEAVLSASASGAQTDATSALSGITAIESALGQGSCGNLFDIQSSACPFLTAAPYIALPACDVSPNNSFCEGDGECGTNTLLNNCGGAYDVYYKMP